MDTFINIIGLASFIYLFILGAKTLKAKITPRPPVYLPVPRTIAAQVQTRLCDKEYEGMPCRIFSSVENDFTLIYTPKPLSRESAEAIIRKQRNGPTGTVELTFFGEYTQFKNRARV